MNLQAGAFLKSQPVLHDTIFSETLIYLVEYNSGGAIGFIVNRPFGRSLSELEAFSHCPQFPLYEGGPVDGEHLYFVHRRPDLVPGGTPVADGIWWSGDFAAAVAALNNQELDSHTLKIFVGYCGWDAGDLEAEIAEGSWKLVSQSADAAFVTV